MKHLKIVAIFLLILVSYSSVFAQETTNDKCACCTETHEDFDFWIGDWTVYDSDGKIIGTNSIQKEYDNCVLREQWESTGTTRGTSYNYYNTTDKTWNQVWIDSNGFSLELKGNYDVDKMVLRSDLLSSEKGKFYHQITWINNGDGSVTQIWDVLSEKLEKTNELFKGLYKKRVN